MPVLAPAPQAVLLSAVVLGASLLLPVAPTAAAPRKSGERVAVLPPPRPAAMAAASAGTEVETTGSLGSTRAASAGRPMPLVQTVQTAAPPSGRAAVERANAALNALQSASADFTQVNSDGRRLSGTLYMQRPGKLRFEYDKPSTLEVVSDGSTVLVRDRKLNTSDPYPISQTPLKFLLAPRIDLSRDATVLSATPGQDGFQVAIEDSTTLGGTSKITLIFDPEVKELRRWRVVDPQGYTTTVSLSEVEKNRAIDPRIFMLNYSRPVE